MQETLYQTADAEVSLSDSGCRKHSIRQRMQRSLYQTADAGDTLSVKMQESLYQTADAGDTLSNAGAGDTLSASGCRMLETLYQTSVERLLHPLSDRVSPAYAV